jgi:hypothetical protein
VKYRNNMSPKTQYDFSHIASRQCSWFCHEVVNHKAELIDLYNEGKAVFESAVDSTVDSTVAYNAFNSKLNDIIECASKKKRDSPDNLKIETLCSDSIVNSYTTKHHFYNITINPRKDDFLHECHKIEFSNADEIKKQKLAYNTLTQKALKHLISSMKVNEHVMINRQSMSFVVIRTMTGYLILDSHYPETKEFDADEVCGYINNTTDYNLILVATEKDFRVTK